MTAAELKALLAEEIKGLSSKFSSDDYTNAVDAAERDTGWSMPVSTDFRIKWMILRAKRHLYSYRRDESADKFKYKQLNLNQRFDNFYKLVENMDKAFEKAQDEYAHEFAGVDSLHLFGTKIDAGFQYVPQTRKDHTYDKNNVVIINPDENA